MIAYVVGTGPTKSLKKAIDDLQPMEVAVLTSSTDVLKSALTVDTQARVKVITDHIYDLDEELLNRAHSVLISPVTVFDIVDLMAEDDVLLVAWDDTELVSEAVYDAIQAGFEAYDVSDDETVAFVDDDGLDDDGDETITAGTLSAEELLIQSLQRFTSDLEAYVHAVVASALAEHDVD